MLRLLTRKFQRVFLVNQQYFRLYNTKISLQDFASFSDDIGRISPEEFKKAYKEPPSPPPNQPKDPEIVEEDKIFIEKNRLEGLKLYKQIVKEVRKQLGKTKSAEITLNYVRDEYKRTTDLKTQYQYDLSLQQAREFIVRLKGLNAARHKTEGSSDNSIRSFWNNYFMTPGSVNDWYFTYDDITKYIPKVKRTDRVLIVGCGLSPFGVQLYHESGSRDITEIDISPVAVDRMKELCKNLEGLRYLEMDVMKLDFPDNHFDVVVDKGTLDTILVEETGEEDIQQMEQNIWRVLKPNGVFFLVSIVPRESIEEIFSGEWKVECVGEENVGDPYVEAKEIPKCYFYHIQKVGDKL